MEVQEKKLSYDEIIKEIIINDNCSNITSYYKKDKIRSSIPKYIEKYPEDKKYEKILRERLKKYKINYISDEDFELDLNRDSESCVYLSILRPILMKNDIKEQVSYIRKMGINKKNYDNYVKKFEDRYSSRKKEVDILKKAYLEYTERYCKEKPEKEVIRYIEKDKEVYYSLLGSGLTTEEFCHINLEIDATYIKDIFIRKAASISKNHKKEIELIKSRSNEELKKIVLSISEKIISDPNFDIIEYFKNTKLSPNDFIKVACSWSNIKLMKKYLTEYFREYNSPLNKPTSLEKELENNLKISGILITDEDKIRVFKYLEKYNIPVTYKTYRAGINRLMNNNLDDELEKIMVKK